MLPDKQGHFGQFGGRFVPETLMPALLELEEAYGRIRRDPDFKKELAGLLKDYVGRPSPLYFAKHLSAELGGPKIYLKREDLNHTGAHKINNTLGQGLLAQRMGKKRVIAETGAGQHGVATATVAALLGMECDIYMGTEDIRRQRLNVIRMKLLGARVIPVESGSCTLKDAMNEAIRDWVTNVRHTHYVIGSVAGPHPYPRLVRDFQAIIGQEARAPGHSDLCRRPCRRPPRRFQRHRPERPVPGSAWQPRHLQETLPAVCFAVCRQDLVGQPACCKICLVGRCRWRVSKKQYICAIIAYVLLQAETVDASTKDHWPISSDGIIRFRPKSFRGVDGFLLQRKG